MSAASAPNQKLMALRKGKVLELLGLVRSENPHTSEALDRRMRGMGVAWLSVLAVFVPGTAILGTTVTTSAGSVVSAIMLWILAVSGWQITRLSQKALLQPHIMARIHTGLALALGAGFAHVLGIAWAAPHPALASAVVGGCAMVALVALSRLYCSMLAFALGLLLLGPAGSSNLLALGTLIALLVCLAYVTLGLLRSDSALDEERWEADQSSLRSNRFIDEVEQNSPGWFWETDRQGAIQYISPKVARWLKSDPEGLIGKPISVLGSDESRNSELGERSIGFYLSTRTSFSELAVATVVGSEERWWSMSGRPVMDQFGHFRGFIGTGNDLTEQRRSADEAVKLSRFDPLTGLANRAETSKLLNRALVGLPGTVRPTGLMLIDLDRFKAVNDSLGHPSGDELLKQVSKRLIQVVGSAGQVGRLGGDEFKVVLPGLSDARTLAQLASAIIREVSRSYKISDTGVSIGASIGIARSPEDGTTSEALVRNADLALYAAKGAGRGVHCFYETGMHSVAEERRRIDEDMRSALLNGQFRLVYQPIVALQSEKIIGFESLIRWNHPTRGPISPSDFIPIAEENGLIDAIGEWTLRQACNEAATWAVDSRVAINISATQFAQPKFPELVASALSQSGLAPDRLEIEITEGVFVRDDESTDRQFELLKKLGVRLALDDFGTGYSSLGYLKRAPLDKIKIDQSFVRGASLARDKNAAIIKAIVSLAETLNMETTAEGVETQDEIDFIRELGCSHIQGFVFGKPLESAELLERLGTRGDEAERVGHKSTREQRLRVIRVAQLTINGRQQAVRMRNISSQGAMIEGPTWITSGTQVAIEILDDITVSGIVRWADDGKIGLKFDHPVDLAGIMAHAAKLAETRTG